MSTPADIIDLAGALQRRAASGVLSVGHSGRVTRILLVQGRAMWVEVEPPEDDLAAAFIATGVVSSAELDSLADDSADEDLLVQALLREKRVELRVLEGIRREVLRGRLRRALLEGRDTRFHETQATLDGIDPQLIPDLDLLALGRLHAGPAEVRPQPVVVTEEEEPAPAFDSEAWRLLEVLYRERHTASWFDLFGLRPGASPASIRRACEDLLPAWRVFVDHPNLDHGARERAAMMVRAVELARVHLQDEGNQDAYAELLRRGGAPRLVDLLSPGADPARLTADSGSGIFAWLRRR